MIERKTVSQCVSEDYCKGWNDAVDAMGNNEYRYETGFIKDFEVAQPKWISVEDALPNDCDKVLVSYLGYVNIAFYRWDHVFELPNTVKVDAHKGNITHWMPLPSAPEVKQ